MAKADDAAGGGKKKGGLLLGLVVPLLVLTIVAAAGGWLIGMKINAGKAVAPTEAKADQPAAMTRAVKELPPIVTNLMAPDGVWVRLQAAVVYDKSDAAQIDMIIGKVTDDTLAYVKTLTATQLQGAAGLQHLREDLNERAGLRSDGHIKDVMIEMLVIE